MTRPRYLRHLTLTTGHQRDSYRDEVDEDLFPMLRNLVAQARLCMAPIPNSQPACTMLSWVGRGRGLLCVVYGPPSVPTDGQSCPLARFWVAPDSLASARAWNGVVKSSAAADGSQPPAAPWCAASLLPGIAIHPAAAQWLGDFERCVAWAWIT